MNRNPELLLAIFEKFTTNPKPIDSRINGWNNMRTYCPAGFSPDDKIVQWHLMMFFNEFVLDDYLIKAADSSFLLSGAEYLTWSGQHLFEELKRIYRKE
jgi:hypothetical protein